MSKISVYNFVANSLRDYGIEEVFGLPGDDLSFMRSISEQNLNYLVAKDQRNAIYMATGYALSSNQMGICNVGKGPAVSNTVTGILEAKNQSVPLLIISSSTNTAVNGKQKAFQEAEEIKLVEPLVKWSHRVENSSSIKWVLKKAISSANSGTPGPVYIEIPEDIGEELVEFESVRWDQLTASRFVPDSVSLQNAKQMIQNAKKPMILLGGGCKRGADPKTLSSFAKNINAPIFVTASGRGCVNEEHPLFCGVGGLYCPEEAMPIIDQCDLVISIGSKLEETVSFGWESLLKYSDVIEINLNSEDFNLDYNSYKLQGDAELTVTKLNNEKSEYSECNQLDLIQLYKNRILEQKQKFDELTAELQIKDILEVIQTHDNHNVTYVHENGLQDMWSYFYPYLVINKNRDAIVPSEQTSLGFGCSASIGVAKAKPNDLVVAFVGDGAFNLFSPELPTLISNQIPIIYIVLKNGGYGWLEHQSESVDDMSPFINKSIPLTTIEHPQLKILHLNSKESVKSVWDEAKRYCLDGKSVVIEMLVNLDDVPPPFKEISGEFPVKENA